MMRALWFLSMFLWVFSYAGIEDYLKKAEGKSDAHKMRNIDFIYMINLDERPEKFMQASEQLHRYGIYPYRFSAVNGWKLPLETINGVGLKYQPGMTPLMSTTYSLNAEGGLIQNHEFMKELGKTYFCHRMPLGSVGCALSHISILEDAWNSGYKTIWVLEDDIEAVKDPRIISDLIDKLDMLVGEDHWDVLFTDQNYRLPTGEYLTTYGAAKRPDLDNSIRERYSDKYTVNQNISPDFRKIAARFTTHSMIIRRSGIKKLLEFSKKHMIYLAYDLENYLVPGINRYSFTYDVVTNMIGAPTDNELPYYEKKE